MKLRLTQEGFEKYTGQMGVVDFEDGLSTTDVLEIDGIRMAAVMGCVWEDGTSPNLGQRYLESMSIPAPDYSGEREATKASQQEAKAGGYTEDQLAAIADEKGIAGLREIAEPLGIKSNSIRMLMDEILKKNNA